MVAAIVFILVVQMIVGRDCVWLPDFISRHQLSTAQLCKGIGWLRKPVYFVEGFLKPRLAFPFSPAMDLSSALPYPWSHPVYAVHGDRPNLRFDCNGCNRTFRRRSTVARRRSRGRLTSPVGRYRYSRLAAWVCAMSSDGPPNEVPANGHLQSFFSHSLLSDI